MPPLASWLLAFNVIAGIGETRMGPIATGTAIGAAALTLGRGAVGAVGNGLSFAAELLRAAGGTQPSGDRAPDKATAAQAALKLQIDELQQRIAQQLATAGVELMQPVDLVSNGQGGIAVTGPHPQQAAIEEILGSDVLLERDFNNLALDYEEFVDNHAAVELPPSLVIAIPKNSSAARL